MATGRAAYCFHLELLYIPGADRARLCVTSNQVYRSRVRESKYDSRMISAFKRKVSAEYDAGRSKPKSSGFVAGSGCGSSISID